MLKDSPIKKSRALNFNAGPSILPLPVLEKAQGELVDFQGSGMSILEMSHRSKEFESVLARAESGLRTNLGIPDDYAVLFLGGGASLQFSMVPMNLVQEGKPVDAVHTGSWTKKAIEEIKKVTEVRLAFDGERTKFTRIPFTNEINVNPNASYIHLCSNNTIAGTQFSEFPETGDVPLVADMSSDICSRKIDVKNFGLIFAGAQKNLGPAGVTVVIIKKDLAERAEKSLPSMLQYRTHIKNNSLYNTPPAYGIYFVALVQEWIQEQGGLAAIEKANKEKANLLYKTIDETGFYSCPVDEESRSLMNVVFRIKGGDEELEDRFVKEAKAAGLIGLKGHRSVGGLRASIYNAQPMDGVRGLTSFMKEFEKKNG